MIPTYTYEQLKTVKRLVTHAECHDGIASAIIVRGVLPNVDVVPVAYGTKKYEELPAEPGILFCDMSPPAGRLQEFVDAKSMILDHHTSAEPIVKALGGVYADEKKDRGVSGALLAFQNVWVPIVAEVGTTHGAITTSAMRSMAEMVGIYDLWVQDDPRWFKAMDLCATLRFFGLYHWLRWSDPVKALEFLHSHQAVGYTVNQSKDKRAAEVLGMRGYELFVSKKGFKIAMFPETVPDKIAGRVMDMVIRDKAGIDIVMAYNYVVAEGAAKLEVSIRSHGDKFDCGEFAKYNGGGGHLNAAGMTLRAGYPLSPSGTLKIIVDEYPGL